MAKRYKVLAKVISQTGKCACGHKVGDEWVIGTKTPEGMCISAFNVLMPNTKVLMFGGSFPYSADPDAINVGCADPKNIVVYQLRRLKS